eukprot:gene27999-33812_t
MGCGPSTNAQTNPSAHGAKPADNKAGTQLSEPKIIITEPKEFNFKPVHSAVRWNKSTQDVEVLLTSQEAIDCVDTNNGNRPIHIAAQNGHDNLVELLIRKKCEVNATNMKGNTALHMAIGYDYYDTAQMLIKAGGDLEAVNEMGVPAKFGLEGDKALGIARLATAASVEDVAEGFDLCEQVVEKLNRVSFAQAGLKAKKALAADWTPELQNRFKSITARIP